MANKITRYEEPQETLSDPDFSVILTPHRSLGNKGYSILMGFIAFSCLVSGALFWIAGAWPVMVTMGVDVLAIWLAFKINYRAARQFEEIFVWPDQVLVRKTSPSGKSREFKFNPFWVKFLVDRHEEYGINAMKLSEKGKQLELGAFLNPDDRNSFASAFAIALANARR